MPNVAQAAWDHAASAPDRIALRAVGAEWTYLRLRERAAAFAGRAAAAGIAPGDRVLLVAPSVPEFVSVYFGLHAAGAVAVTSNTMSTPAELDYVIDDAGCALVVAWHETATSATAAAAGRGVPCWTFGPDVALEGDDAPPLDTPHPAADDETAVILYTSGTTGRPKGAQLTHRNLIACAEMFGDVLEVSPEDRFGTALPLFHVFGQAVIMGTVLRTGASLSLLARFDAVELLEMLRRDQLTAMAGVPTMWNAMLHAAGDFALSDFASLRLAASGGASLPAEVMRAFGERFGALILEGYGLTETTGTGTFNGIHRERKQGTVGIALPGCEVEIRDPQGNEVAAGEVGEVFISGPAVMKGYWNRPDATAEALPGGWLRTGDLGTKDHGGDLRIVDRVKDLVIRGGYNVYPREVEEVLYEHPDVVEVAVIGVPDAHFGEELAAVMALRDGSQLTGEELRAWAKERVSAYKIPRLYHVVDALPKGPTGKILKRRIDPQAVLAAAGPAIAPQAQVVA